TWLSVPEATAADTCTRSEAHSPRRGEALAESEQLSEQEFAGISWKILHDVRAKEIGEWQRKALPQCNGGLKLRIGRVELRHGSAIGQPVVPIQLMGLGAPLLFEAVSSALHSRSSEIKQLTSLLTGIFEDAAVEQHIRSQSVISMIGRRP